MTSAPLVLNASEIRFPAIAAPPVEVKSDMERILNFGNDQIGMLYPLPVLARALLLADLHL